MPAPVLLSLVKIRIVTFSSLQICFIIENKYPVKKCILRNASHLPTWFSESGFQESRKDVRNTKHLSDTLGIKIKVSPFSTVKVMQVMPMPVTLFPPSSHLPGRAME